MTQSLTKQLSALDRFLPLWILAAMALGLALGRIFPTLGVALDAVKIFDVSAPLAVGLLAMMYPPLAKVRYGKVGELARDRKLFGLSLFLNWFVGPILMVALAWIFLPDMPEYRNGLVLIGLARCIAMVLIWNQLACGSAEIAAALVALNSLFQILTYSVYGWFFLTVLPEIFGQSGTAVNVTMGQIAKNVLIFLGIPFALGFLSSVIFTKQKGEEWYRERFIPKISPLALGGLLYTITLMFAMQGDKILTLPLDVARIALPLAAYFLLMFLSALLLSRRIGLNYEKSAATAFTAAGNNFELAIAVAVATFGISSGEALAAVVGPLIEVPALVGLVYVSLALKKRMFGE